MKNLWNWFAKPPVDGPAAILILRLMTGAVFFWEGILKYVYPNLGVGRFLKLGFAYPVFTANFIAVLEITGGLCLMLGLFTRVFSSLFIVEMAVAILATKITMYMGTFPLPIASPPKTGIWAVLHEIRSEYAQMLTCIFYCIVGPGVLSLDARLRKKSQPTISKVQTSQMRPPKRPVHEPPRDYSNLSH